jgi:hypothetical protein
MLSRLADPDTLQVVRLARKKWARRSPFRLPFRILAVGQRADSALDELRSTGWYHQSQYAGAFGLHLETVSPVDVAEALRAPVRDVLVTDTLGRDIRHAVRALPVGGRPRVIMVLESTIPEAGVAPEVFCPPGASLLSVPPPFSEAGTFLRAVLYGLIHDLPLHEVLKAALRELGVQPAGWGQSRVPLLVADPQSNQDLRILDALAELRKEGVRLDIALGAPELEVFLGRSGERLVPELQQELRLAFFGEATSDRDLLDNAISSARSVRAIFEQESLGLLPLAETEAVFNQARGLHQRAVQTLTAMAGRPELIEVLREHQHRYVDVALERLQTEPLLGSVDKEYTLAPLTRYQLRVHVGHRLADSLVVGEPPELDPLLPDPEGEQGHTLEVAVQGKDFALLSATVQELYLPLVGGSEPIYFTIRTPQAHGPATLRISIYYKNHLLQSYLLEAQVTNNEEPMPLSQEPPLRVQLKFSRTTRFTNLDELGDRALSIGANQSQTTSTHELTVKSDGAMGELSLPPLTFDREMKEFRDILLYATFDPPNSSLPRVYPEVPPGTAPSAEMAAIVRRLAKKGNELYRAVFRKAGRNAKLQRALQAIRQQSDQTLQVVRFDETFVFPWSLIYDYDLPEERSGALPKPVCLGVTTDGSGAVEACSHPWPFDGYCANGFWGVRHYIEELVDTGQGDAVKAVVCPRGAGAIRIVADPNMPEAASLAGKLQQTIGQAAVVVGPEDDALLIDLLWKTPPERPAVLIVLGHLETQILQNEPESPRIVLMPGTKWLTEEKLSQRYGDDLAWRDQPRTLVLLMACESAATGVETINDFVTVLNAAGAAAVIGTECIVFSRLVARFAEEVTLALWQQTPLGKAITSFRRGLLRAGNPLAFVFHAVGDADLVV